MPSYCTQNDGACATCALSNYGRDCQNNPISPDPEDVRAARQAAGLTQEKAAEIIGATRRAWQEWEGGRRNMPPAKLELFQIKTREKKMHTYYISTDSASMEVEAENLEAALREFDECPKKVKTASDFEQWLCRVGGFGFITEDDIEIARVRS